MKFNFHKYHGAGKDFLLLDNREKQYENIDKYDLFLLCDRHFGVGADGVVLLNSNPEVDFSIQVYLPNGKEVAMSGAGGRCAVLFAHTLGVIKQQETTFLAHDGIHHAKLLEDNQVSLSMKDVTKVDFGYDTAVFDLGIPHCVKFTEYLGDADMIKEGRKLRASDDFKETGVSLSYLEYGTQALEVRTYEMGVEDEVLSSTAGAMVSAMVVSGNQSQHYSVPVKMKGGDIEVSFDKENQQTYRNILITGPTEKVFEGEITLKEKWRHRVSLYDKIVGLKT